MLIVKQHSSNCSGLCSMIPFRVFLEHPLHVLYLALKYMSTIVMTLNSRTDRFGQTVQTQIRLLLEEQSDQGIHCLLIPFALF